MSLENETVEPLDADQAENEPAVTPPSETEPTAVAAEMSVDVTPSEDGVTSTPEAEPPPPPKSVRKTRQADEVIAYFAACGRCGYFLTGYRAAFGRQGLETAVAAAKGGWLTFPWSITLRELVLTSYGSRIEATDYHFDGCCSECRRSFTYHASEQEGKPGRLRIEIKPRRRQ